jgi:hypothetical protein
MGSITVGQSSVEFFFFPFLIFFFDSRVDRDSPSTPVYFLYLSLSVSDPHLFLFMVTLQVFLYPCVSPSERTSYIPMLFPLHLCVYPSGFFL